MSTIKKFEDLEVWRQSRELCNEIYQLTLQEMFSKDFGLKDQIRGSSGSVMETLQKVLKETAQGSLYNFFLFQKARVVKAVHNYTAHSTVNT